MHWATGGYDTDGMRRRILRFCLRGLGVATEVIEEVISDVMESG
jgi:hypothetical protein